MRCDWRCAVLSNTGLQPPLFPFFPPSNVYDVHSARPYTFERLAEFQRLLNEASLLSPYTLPAFVSVRSTCLSCHSLFPAVC
jgi:hypothetical protein